MPKRQMLINYVPSEECRIAIVEDGKLEEFYQERTSSESHVGNIYKGKVCNVEPSIQAAFIDFGLERNGFLHISDLHPMYFPGDAKEETEQVGLKTPRRERPPIQRCLRRGQTILVQVLKEGIGTKGPTLTSYLSIPGRYLVMMPNMEKLGVSRKLDDDEARRNIRDVLAALNPPKGFGFIGRTRAVDATRTDLKRDLAYLTRLWKNIDRRMKETRIGELFAESDLVIRTIRDIYSSDIDAIIVDDETAARRARDFLTISNPRSGSNVLVYRDPVPLFDRYDIERQIETINSKVVPLPSGGSLIIESTEALVAIDVNSGKNRENRDAESTAYQTNLEAVDEICRQLRLRDLGGVIVNDLIDMLSASHRREVETKFRDNLKNDRARTRTSPISQFGILEMTRQRMRPSLKRSIYTDCPSCNGAGQVKSPESVVLDVMRRLALAMQRQNAVRLELTVSPDVAFQLLNRKRGQLVALEQQHEKPVTVRVNGGGGIDYVGLVAFDARGTEIESNAAERWPEPVLEPAANLPDELGLEPDLEAMADEVEDDGTEATAASVGTRGTEVTGGDEQAPVTEGQGSAEGQGKPEGEGRSRGRRRGRGRGRGRGRDRDQRDDSQAVPAVGEEQASRPQDDGAPAPEIASGEPEGGRRPETEHDITPQDSSDQDGGSEGDSEGGPGFGQGQQGQGGPDGQDQEGGGRRRRRRRRRGRRGGGGGGQTNEGGQGGGQPGGPGNSSQQGRPRVNLTPDDIGNRPEPKFDEPNHDADDDAPQPGNIADPSPSEPGHADEIDDSVGNLIDGHQPGQQPGQPQQDGEGGGKRRRRRRGGRGRGRRGRGGEGGAGEGGPSGNSGGGSGGGSGGEGTRGPDGPGPAPGKRGGSGKSNDSRDSGDSDGPDSAGEPESPPPPKPRPSGGGSGNAGPNQSPGDSGGAGESGGRGAKPARSGFRRRPDRGPSSQSTNAGNSEGSGQGRANQVPTDSGPTGMPASRGYSNPKLDPDPEVPPPPPLSREDEGHSYDDDDSYDR
ncbi:MAG: Rne/Rng family ribonuclease [Planctomycetota bacterium]|nr:Rne/Rng family ribonuclease [Planctomycetota bacterium]